MLLPFLCQYDWLPKKRLIALDRLVERLLLGLAQRSEWLERQQHAILLDHPLPGANDPTINSE
jgi:hypothetical protein